MPGISEFVQYSMTTYYLYKIFRVALLIHQKKGKNMSEYCFWGSMLNFNNPVISINLDTRWYLHLSTCIQYWVLSIEYWVTTPWSTVVGSLVHTCCCWFSKSFLVTFNSMLSSLGRQISNGTKMNWKPNNHRAQKRTCRNRPEKIKYTAVAANRSRVLYRY